MGPSIGQILASQSFNSCTGSTIAVMAPPQQEPKPLETVEHDARTCTEELADFGKLCEQWSDDENWIIVDRARRKTSKKERMNAAIDYLKAAKEIPDLSVLSFEDDAVHPKETSREHYEKHKYGRRNKKEERRFKLRQRLRKRNERILRNDVVPHGLEDDYPNLKFDKDANVVGEVNPNYEKDYERAKESVMKYEPTVATDDPPGPLLYPSDESDDEVEEKVVAQEPPGQFDDASEASIKTNMRNELVHAIDAAKPLDPSDPELRSLLSSVGELESWKEAQGFSEIEEWVSHLENLVLLGYHMYKAESFVDIFAAVASYAKMNTKKSMVMELYRLVEEVTSSMFDEIEEGDVEPAGWKDWSGADVIGKWELFKNHAIFAKVSYLMTAAMSLTVCATKKIEWNPFGLKLISLEAAKEQLKAVDVIDALVKTLVWISEVGWKCIESRSIAPLLYSDVKMQEYNEMCDYVIANSEAAVAGNIDDLGEYEKKLQVVFKKTCTMKALKDTGATALWLQKRYEQLTSICEKLAAKRRNTDVRMQPIGFSLSGPTSVGKTTLGKITMIQSLSAMGFVDSTGQVDESRILTMDMFDKYQSTWTSDILGVFMDDIGNAKADFQKDNPHTSVIIKFFNNVAAQAIKAELNAKGVVFIDFKVGIVTTNVKDLDARCYSNCPESILRRFFHVSVAIKEEYRKPGSTMLNKAHPDVRSATSLVHDVWNLKIEEVVTYEIGNNKTDWKFEIMSVDLDDGRTIKCENLDLKTYLDVIIQLSINHKAEQDSLLAKSKKSSRTKFCQRCRRFPEFCCCPSVKDVEPAAYEMIGDVISDAASKAMTSYVKSWTRPVSIINWFLGFWPVKKMQTWALAKELEYEMNRVGTPLVVALTPQFLFKTRLFQKSVSAWQSSAALYDIRKPMRLLGGLSLGLLGHGVLYRNTKCLVSGSILGIGGSVVGYHLHQVRLAHIKEEYLRKRDALPSYAKKLRDGNGPKGVLMVATLALGVKLISMWNAKRLATSPQGLTPEEVEAQPGWFGYMMKQLKWEAKPTATVVGATASQAVEKAAKHLGIAHFTRSDGSKTRCNIVFPDKGVMWYPYHIWFPNSDMTKEPVEYLDVVVKRNDSKCSQIKFKAQLDFNTTIVKGKDMVQTFVPGCPDVASGLTNWLPVARPSGTAPCVLTVRNEAGKLENEHVAVTYGNFGHKYMPMFGGEYTTKTAASGTCMGMLVLDGANPVITGFHIGGAPKRSYGVMMSFTKSEAETLIGQLLKLPGVRGIAKSTDLPKEQYGIPLLETTEVNPMAKFIVERPDDAAIDVYGSTQQRSQMKSRVVPSMLKDDVVKIFDINRDWGPPKLKPNWVGFNATLSHIMNPSEMFLPSLLERARQDYLGPIKEFAKTRDDIRVLTLKEVIMGIPGVRFIDAMPMNTSMGKPVMGPKSKHFTEIRDGEKLVDRIPSDDVMREYHRLEECWKRGERGYPITNATLKDEPTDVNSDKVRVFQAVAVAMGMHIRKRFLPIARLLSLCPELSESAVGVNAFSHQWEDLMLHAEKYAAGDRVVAWDYSKYDVRMNAQITYAVLMSFIDLAEIVGYPFEELYIMNMMVADMIHPLMDYNGTMIMAFNMNTSGNNITVNINDVANSFYVRMGFFDACPEVSDFRSAVAALTYGDDFKGSVHPDYRNRFNFTSMYLFLHKHGMKITEPKKTDVVEDDMHVDDADFLKRHSQFIPQLGYRIGRLDFNSMIKPLIANVKSKGEPERNVAMSCIETFMHELFAHGEEVYNENAPKIRQLCRIHSLPVPAANLTFADRVEFHRQKYGDPPVRPSPEKKSSLKDKVAMGLQAFTLASTIFNPNHEFSDSDSEEED